MASVVMGHGLMRSLFGVSKGLHKDVIMVERTLPVARKDSLQDGVFGCGASPLGCVTYAVVLQAVGL
ncbi:hypothetical protein U1Q18_018368 [Sarracenia purpurea var. burkii]